MSPPFARPFGFHHRVMFASLAIAQVPAERRAAPSGVNGHRRWPFLTAFRYAAVAVYAGLLAAWLTVAVRTAAGSLRGDLFVVNPAAAAPATRKGDVAPVA